MDTTQLQHAGGDDAGVEGADEKMIRVKWYRFGNHA